MASPKIIVFTIYNVGTGVPQAGLTPTFSVYKDDTGSNLAQPTISEIGGGLYKFTPTFTTDKGIAYIIDTTANPAYLAGYLRPEDFYIDDIQLIKKIQSNKWSIVTAGPDANHMIIYDDDGVTTLLKLLLTDAGGSPTTVNPYGRTPV